MSTLFKTKHGPNGALRDVVQHVLTLGIETFETREPSTPSDPTAPKAAGAAPR
jgi:hypothetical protein